MIILQIIFCLIGGFIGRLFIGGILNFILDEENPDPEGIYGWIGYTAGALLTALIIF